MSKTETNTKSYTGSICSAPDLQKSCFMNLLFILSFLVKHSSRTREVPSTVGCFKGVVPDETMNPDHY